MPTASTIRSKRTHAKGDGDPGWQRVSWQTALDDIANRLERIRKRYGAKALALGKGTRSGTSVDDVERWLGRFLYLFGRPNWVSTTHVCTWHKDTAFSYTFGTNIPTPDLANSKTFLQRGHDPSATSLILAQDIVTARTRGMKTVVVDPRRIGLGTRADILLQPTPGTDGALALAVDQRTFFDRHCNQQNFDGGGSYLRRITSSLCRVGSIKRTAVIYDSAGGEYEWARAQPALFDKRSVKNKNGCDIACGPVMERLAEIAAGL